MNLQDTFKKILFYLKGKWVTFYNHIDKVLNVAFKTTEKKRLFWVMVGAGELLIFYLIAVLDMGLWTGDNSIPGLLAAYILSEKSYPWILFLLVSAAILVVLYVRLNRDYGGNTGRGFDISESNVYGDAKEITREELEQVAEIVPIQDAMGTILGKMDETDQNLITSKPNPNFNRNSFFVAPPGSGKTHCIVLPQIVQAIRRGESVVTTDTKGELWAKTVELARSHGYIIRRIDFKDPNHSNGWDFMSEVRNSPTRAKIASNIFIANTGSEKDVHKDAEDNLFSALLLYTALNSSIAPEHQSLYNVYTMMNQSAETLDAMFEAVKDDPDMRVAYDFYASFLNGSGNLRSNVIAGLSKRLNIVADPGFRDLTSIPDVDLSLPGKEKCIYYVELPDQHGLVRFLSSLLFSFLFLDLTDYADSRMDQKLPVPVNVVIEEAYACGKIETITNALSTQRSRGVGIMLIAQGIPQFLELYGPNMTATIQECCSTFGCLSANSKETAEFFSWMSGVATVDVQTEHHVVGEGPIAVGRSYTKGQGRQELFTGNDVRKIQFQRILLVWQRMDPKMAYTFGIHEHPEMKNGHMPQIMPTTKVSIHDTEARAFIRAMEEERVQRYREWEANGGDPWPDYNRPKPVNNGPCRKEPIPSIIPYADLENMALEHSAQANVEPKDALLERLKKSPAGTQKNRNYIPSVPAGFQWHQEETVVHYTDNFDEDGIDEEDIDDTPQAAPAPQKSTQQPEQITVSSGQTAPAKPSPPPERPNPKKEAVPSSRRSSTPKSIIDQFGSPNSLIGEEITPFPDREKAREDKIKKDTKKISF